MITESYGGKCPVCGFTRILMRYGSFGYYQFDACPRCGFAYGTNHDTENTNAKDVWKAILKADAKLLSDQGFPVTIEGMFEWVNSIVSPPPQTDRDTVFVYKKEDVEEYKKSKLYKERMRLLKERGRLSKEKVVFT